MIPWSIRFNVWFDLDTRGGMTLFTAGDVCSHNLLYLCSIILEGIFSAGLKLVSKDCSTCYDQ